jgi:TetR/AcrR family transcriptional regulator, transcriptional repressor for nem operon
MKKSEKTRQYIIERTAPLFNKQGFQGTSLTDLTEATGLTKGAIYGNFSDKKEIACEAFKYSISKVRKLVASKVSGAVSYKGQLEALLNFYSEYVFRPPIPGGCPLLNTAIEADDDQPFLRKVLVEELTSTVGFIESLLKKGTKAGEFKKHDAHRLAYVFFCSVEGALMFSRAERSEEPMNIVVKHCKQLLDEITI